MSLSGALSAATSGLSAAARSAELVSSNVANALTQGYGRQEIRLAASTTGGAGGGVQVVGLERVTDSLAIGQRRFADAAFGHAQQYANFFSSFESVVGTPEKPNSLSAHIADLEASLISAIASPESTAQLSAVAYAAKDLTQSINAASAFVQQTRQTADTQIDTQVSALNNNLSLVAELNDQIEGQIFSGGDPSGFMDQRQRLID